MKGKILNVRGETKKKISENAEIADMKKILGLESGKKYTDEDDVNPKSSLREDLVYDRSGFGWKSYQGIVFELVSDRVGISSHKYLTSLGL